MEGGEQARVQAGVNTAKTNKYTHIPWEGLHHKHLQEAGGLIVTLHTYHHHDGPQDEDVQRKGGDGVEGRPLVLEDDDRIQTIQSNWSGESFG